MDCPFVSSKLPLFCRSLLLHIACIDLCKDLIFSPDTGKVVEISVVFHGLTS